MPYLVTLSRFHLAPLSLVVIFAHPPKDDHYYFLPPVLSNVVRYLAEDSTEQYLHCFLSGLNFGFSGTALVSPG